LATPTRVPPTFTPTRQPTPVPPTSTPVPTQSNAPISTPISESDPFPKTQAAWQQFVNELAGAPDAQARADEFWNQLSAAHREPLIVQDAVIFLYKGDAVTVSWLGDFNFWETVGQIQGARVPNTNLWYGVANFPRDSRTDYQIVVNGSEILDAANSYNRNDGLGINNVLTMPDFKITDETKPRKGVPAGTLTDWIPFDSQAMGYTINYRVYTPANYDSLQTLPVFYVTDGENFYDPNIGAMAIVMDNLIAEGRMSPAMAVFIDPREPDKPQNDRRNYEFLTVPENFAQFITQELIPKIDAQYHTDASPAGRVMMGASFGGAFGTFAVLRYPDVFGNLAAFSPAYWVYTSSVGASNQSSVSGGQRMNNFVMGVLNCEANKNPCPTAPQKIFFSTGEAGWDVGDLKAMTNLFRGRGDTVQVFQIAEGHNWGSWAGLTDEMLEYFIGK
jgi:enterochelin esterase-like enzyme